MSLASDDVRDAALALSIARETRQKTLVAIVLGLGPGALAAVGIALDFLALSVGPLLSLAGLQATTSVEAHGIIGLDGASAASTACGRIGR